MMRQQGLLQLRSILKKAVTSLLHLLGLKDEIIKPVKRA